MAQNSSVVDRVRKLRRLAESPNENEAARAAEQAEALMRKHGLTELDVGEDVIEVIDSVVNDYYRACLATSIAGPYRCKVIYRKKDGMAFKGPKMCVAEAKALYQEQLAAMSEQAMPPIAEWVRPKAYKIWRFAWRKGFLSALLEQFGPPKQTTEPAMEGEASEDARAFEDVKADAVHASYDLHSVLDLAWLSEAGFKAGQAAAQRISAASKRLALEEGKPCPQP